MQASFADPNDGVTDTVTILAGVIQASEGSGPTTCTWNAGTGDWTNADNWSPTGVPAAGAQIDILSANSDQNIPEGNPQIDRETVTLDGNAVQNGGEIDVGATALAVLTLTDGASIVGGALNIETFGEVYAQHNIPSAFGAVLDDVTVTMTGDGDFEIGSPIISGPTLILEDGTTISGGASSLVQSTDSILVQAGGPPQTFEAILDGVAVDNSGTVEIDENPRRNADARRRHDHQRRHRHPRRCDQHAGHRARRQQHQRHARWRHREQRGQYPGRPRPNGFDSTDGTIVSGGILTIGLGAGEVDIDGSATFDGVFVSNSSLLQIDAGGTLTIADTVTLGGSLDVGEVTMGAGSKIAEASTDTGAVVFLYNTNDVIEGSGQIGDGTGRLALTNSQGGNIGATISGATLTLDTGDAITNTGALAAINGATLLIDDVVSNNTNGDVNAGNNSGVTGTVKIENAVTNGSSTATVNAFAGSTVELDSGTISGGKVTTAAASASPALLAGIDPGMRTSAINNASSFITNSGELNTGGTFTLDGDTVTGGILTGTSPTAAFNIDANKTTTFTSTEVLATGGITVGLSNNGTLNLGSTFKLGGGAFDAGTQRERHGVDRHPRKFSDDFSAGFGRDN